DSKSAGLRLCIAVKTARRPGAGGGETEQQGRQSRRIAGSEEMTMKLTTILAAISAAALALAIAPAPPPVYSVELDKPIVPQQPASKPLKTDPREKHLRNIRQLTFNGDNAEAYFSFDGKKITFQSTREPFKCDQIFQMNLDGSHLQLISTGKGRTTCSYFFPDGKHIIYASTHLASPDCPPPADNSKGYVWAIYPSFDIFKANAD